MVRLVAKTDMRYASKQLTAGEIFEATESDALVLKGTGKASDTADDETEESTVQPRKARTYRRRDMFAESKK